MNTSALDPIAERAIDWMVRFGGGTLSPAERADFDAWLAADPRHRSAWQQVSTLFDAPVAALKQAEVHLPGQRRAARQALSGPAPASTARAARRKALRGGGLAMLLLGLGGHALNRQSPLAGLAADLHTATGERRQVQLADGSTLILNARSVVDIEFSATTRLLRLRQGEILVQTATDPARPLIVHTEHGLARALGTRFAVRLREGGDGNHAELAVLEHRVQLTSAGGTQRIVEAGNAARFTAGGIQAIDGPAAPLAAWADGLLDIRDRPLGEVVAALRGYARGYLRVSPRAAALRVYGVFPLDDPDAALQSLAETQPISLRRYGALLTLIAHRDEDQ